MDFKLTLGDSKTLQIPLTWERQPFIPDGDWNLIFTAKADLADADADAIIQKSSGYGITESGNIALVALVHEDTSTASEGLIYYDVQAQKLDDPAEVRTVAEGHLRLKASATQELSTSIPIITTEPGIPTNPAPAIHAATAKTTAANADEFALADSADSYALKKITFSNLKASLNIPDTSGLMAKSANLSDVADVATARSNLGLGGAAVLSTSTGGGGSEDAGKVAVFVSDGGLYGSSQTGTAVNSLTDSGTALNGNAIGTGVGLVASSAIGDYHATFGGVGDDRSFIERVKGVFGWWRGAFTGKIKAADTLTNDRVWTFPDVPNGNVVIDTATQTLTNKTFTAPVLGTPASGNLANCTVGTTHGVAKAILTKTSNFTAELGGRYITESGGTISVTDPTGTTAGDSYEVWIGSGSIQFNGTGTSYSASRFSIRRRYNGSAWTTPSPTLTDTLTVGSGTWNGSTISGAQTMSGQLELTGQSATNGTSAMTRDLVDARFGRLVAAVATSNVNRNSTTTYADDSACVIPLEVGTYVVDAWIMLDNASTFGSKFRLNFTGTASMYGRVFYGAANTTPAMAYNNSGLIDASYTLPYEIVNASTKYNNGGGEFIVVVTVAGNLSWQWAQNTSGATDTRRYAGSRLIARKIA